LTSAEISAILISSEAQQGKGDLSPNGGTGRHSRLADKLSTIKEILYVNCVKFGELLTDNAEPSRLIGRCRD